MLTNIISQRDRKFDKFARNKSVDLVRQILACSDELSSICSVTRENISVMNEMLKHAQREEENERKYMTSSGGAETCAEDEVNGLLCESARQRIEWALSILTRNLKCFESLLVDLRFATDAVSLNLHFPNKLLDAIRLQLCASSLELPQKLATSHSSYTNHFCRLISYGQLSKMSSPLLRISRTRQFSSLLVSLSYFFLCPFSLDIMV